MKSSFAKIANNFVVWALVYGKIFRFRHTEPRTTRLSDSDNTEANGVE